ncbi:lipoprotein [Nitritalea halalkaliphila LW7]|uniref:Lipoprotein n=1 Tax=Nitritalea halalkaliphila LW7 TaxID=1189621 RepID=I5C4R5_9BACT|nr:DUF4136 domain-containing protein [Nitritalea halalkaliphila]EIM76817.1 lipoprotein [Nitritalea halalkaliphila LW7]
MFRTTYLLWVGAFLLLASCSSIDIFKEKTEIPPYGTYKSFVIVNQETGFRAFNNEFYDELVLVELQRHLEDAGLHYEKTNPDLIIRFGSNEDPRQKEIINNPGMMPMWGMRMWAWDPFMFNPMMMPQNFNNSRTRNYELMQLIVDFIDPKQEKYLMRVTAVTEVQSDREKKRRLIKSTDKVVKTYQQHLVQR